MTMPGRVSRRAAAEPSAPRESPPPWVPFWLRAWLLPLSLALRRVSPPDLWSRLSSRRVLRPLLVWLRAWVQEGRFGCPVRRRALDRERKAALWRPAGARAADRPGRRAGASVRSALSSHARRG